MTIRNFDFLFKPHSVALIGASTRPGSVGLITAQSLLSGGFSGPIWFVNPKHSTIAGHDCYPSVAELPSAPDLAVIVTPPQTIPQLIGELGAKGTRAAVVITAGMRGDLKQAMLDASRPYTLRIQGPNCVGLMLPRIGLNASFSPKPLAGDIAFLSQSGALITGIIDWAHGRNIGFSHVVSLGDMADVDFGDLLDYLAADASLPLHPALYGIGHARAEVHVGRPARRQIQTRHRRQGRPQRHRRQGGALAHRRAGRRRCSLRRRVPACGPAARARAGRSLQCGRDAGAASRLVG